MIINIGAVYVSQLTPDELKDYVVVDVRREDEFAEGHIPGSIHIPHDEINDRSIELENFKDQKVLLVCHLGGRSLLAAEILEIKGFAHIYNMEGGMDGWSGEISLS